MPGPGQMLREARESRGLSQEDVARETHIRIEYLDALEQDNYAGLPGDVYTRGFLRNYSGIVGLNSADVIASYEGRNDPPRKRSRPGATPPPPPVRRQEPIRIQPLSPTSVDTRVRYAPSFWLMGLLAVVLLIAGYLAYNTFTGIRQAPTQAATPTTLARATITPLGRPTVLVSQTPVWTPFPTPGGPGVAGPAPAPPVAIAATPSRAPVALPPGAALPTLLPGALAGIPGLPTAGGPATPSPTPGGGITVQVTVGSQNAWMKVDVDGKTVWGATLAAGSSRVWTGLSTIRIRFARADITSVNINGVDKGLAGDSTQTLVTKEWDAAGNERVLP